jgi:tetratricopeptide (TPR) repeat protein
MKAEELNQLDSEVQYDLGRAYFDLGRYRECLLASRNALMYDPEMTMGQTNLGIAAMTNLGLAYMHLKEYGKAEECFRKNANLLAPNFFNLGLAKFRQGKYDDALESFLKAVDLLPGDPEYWDMVANAYLELGRLDEGRAALEKAIAVDDTYALAHYDLGVTLSRMDGQNGKALECFERAIALDNKLWQPYYAIACIHAAVRRKDLALEYLDHAVRRGFSDRAWLDGDKDWDGLREDTDFLRIAERVAG